MTERKPTYVRSPHIGMFQYPAAGPPAIHTNPNRTLLPASMPYVGTFRHDVPFFMPDWLLRRKAATRDVAMQTEPDLTAYVIANYK